MERKARQRSLVGFCREDDGNDGQGGASNWKIDPERPSPSPVSRDNTAQDRARDRTDSCLRVSEQLEEGSSRAGVELTHEECTRRFHECSRFSRRRNAYDSHGTVNNTGGADSCDYSAGDEAL